LASTPQDRPRLNRSRLVKIQRLIEDRVLSTISGPVELPENPLIVGLDAAYSRRYGGVGVAALVTLEGSLITYSVSLGEPRLPYIPGLLAFREAPLLYTALHKLLRENRVDVIIVDGHGVSHPRHTGIASHIGIAINKPSIGVAKKRLYGREEVGNKECEPPPCVAGYLVEAGHRLAAIIRTRTGSRIYVSPGAHITLEQAVNIVLENLGKRPLPAATYHADKISKRIARLLDRGSLTPRDLRSKKLTDFTSGHH
jgi:deoxyribonuclease V